MALASLAVRTNKKSDSDFEDAKIDFVEVSGNKARTMQARGASYFEPDRELARVYLRTRKHNQPTIEGWFDYAISALILVSIGIVGSSFFIVGLAVKSGNIAASAASIFALLTFSIVGIASYKVKQSLKFLNDGKNSR